MSQSDFVTRGQALVSSGQYQEAVKVCRLGLLGRPTAVEGRIVLGQALLALKRYDEVLAEMRVALELDHASVAAHMLKGEALLRKGDGQAALEALRKVRDRSAEHAPLAALLAEIERLAGRSASAHSYGSFSAEDSAAFSSDQGTRNYPAHDMPTRAEPPLDAASADDAGGEYTRPTNIAPNTRRRSSQKQAAQLGEPFSTDAQPIIQERTRTVEVDAALVVETANSDDDLGELVEPPIERNGRGAARSRTTPAHGTPGQPTRRTPRPAELAAIAAQRPGRGSGGFKEVSTVELDEDEMVEVEDFAVGAGAGPDADPIRTPGTAMHSVVQLPGMPPPSGLARSSPSSSGRVPVPAAPAHLAQLIANQPHAMNTSPVAGGRPAMAAATPSTPEASLEDPGYAEPAAPLVMPQAGRLLPLPGIQPAPQLPPPHLAMTMIPAQQPAMGSTLVGPPPVPMDPANPYFVPPQLHEMHDLPLHLQSSAAAGRATVMMPSSEPVQGGPPGAGDPGSPWQRPTIMVGGAPPRGPELPRRAPELDPQLAAMIGPPGSSGDSAPNKSMRSSARRVRSRLQLAVWVMIGAAVIGGGVFAGFQIRAMRLGRQITAARERAVDLARTDTWQGWIGARDALSSIVHASPTSDNEAALARSRGVLAYEFGDGAADAKAAIDGLAGQPSLDLDLAAGYLALAQSDGKTARELADRALHAAPDDPAALYISGQASLLAGDIKSAVADLRRALDRESRPLYAVALARALAASSAWDEALTTIDRGTDNPAAVIEKAFLVTGRAAAVPGNELRAQLAKLVAEGGKPAGEQARSVSPSQIAAAQLALAQVDFARSDTDAARTDSLAALAVGLNDQRFAELLSETLYAIGELDVARRSASRALETWPASRRARTTLAQVWLGLGKPAQALDLFAKDPEAASWAKGQTVRGQARLATGDLEGARADFDTALKKLPGYEPALIAGAWADLSTGSVGEAKQRIEPKFNPKSPTQAMAAVYAAILRATGEAAARTKAKALLERAAAGGPSPDALRVQLELARIDRELGDTAAARAAYAEAARSGNVDARFEGALYSIEAGDLGGARTAFEQLLGQAGQAGQSTQPGDHPSAAVMLETARARTLTGAHAEAAALLAAADEAPGVVRWQLDRERARIALRRDDTSGAAQALVRALDGCGADLETFLLAADTVAADATQTQLAARLKALVPVRLRGKPELEIIAGKLDLAATPRPRLDDAERHYNTARNALRRELATPRRRAQADYGIAAVAYAKSDDPTAGVMLELVHGEDPSIDPAYLFSAELIRLKDPRKALGFAQQAATYNPESLDAWKLIGTLAAQLGDRKLLTEAITRAGDLAPGSETLHELQKLR